MAKEREIPINPIHSINEHISNGKTYLLSIGIDKYPGVTPLDNAVKDAEAVAKCLIERYQVDADNCNQLYDEDATGAAIFKAFEYYLNTLTEQDNLIFYFSGHGSYFQPTQMGYWLPVDAVSGERNTYLSNSEVIGLIRSSRARHIFGIVDSCFSASLFTQRADQVSAPRLYHIPSRWLLTAGRLEPVSDGSLGQHSPFAQSLLQQLRYSDGEELWVSELCQRVLRGVLSNSDQQTPRGQSLQNAGDQGGEFILLKKGQKPPSTSIIPEEKEAPSSPIQGLNKVLHSTSSIIKTPISKSRALERKKDKLAELIAEEEWEEAFNELSDILASGNKRNTSILLRSRYTAAKNMEQSGTQQPKFIQLTYNKLKSDMLGFISDLKERHIK